MLLLQMQNSSLFWSVIRLSKMILDAGLMKKSIEFQSLGNCGQVSVANGILLWISKWKLQTNFLCRSLRFLLGNFERAVLHNSPFRTLMRSWLLFLMCRAIRWLSYCRFLALCSLLSLCCTHCLLCCRHTLLLNFNICSHYIIKCKAPMTHTILLLLP